MKAAGGVLTAKQAPRRPGTAPAPGLRASGVVFPTVPQTALERKCPMTLRSIVAALRSVPPLPRVRAPGRRAGFRPRLEPLEDRTVPSTFTVLNLADGGDGSLRQAVFDANVNPGADEVRFADGLQGTIALTGGQLSITDHLTVDGPGAESLAVSGSGQGRVFEIGKGVAAVLDGLTITHGQAENGGGIYNAGALLVSRCTLSTNRAVGGEGDVARGGGIFNAEGA